MGIEAGAELGGRYVLRRQLAVGGMGEVWCAEDRLLGRQVAVKVPRPEVRADPGFAERLLTEARHAAAVHHPGIAAVFDVGAAEPLPYLVLELVEGRPLSHVIADEAPLPPARVRHLVCQVAEALDAAHSAGLVHRDVKPANLLVTADDTVKVTDFGISRAVDSAATTRTGFVVGTAQYLSPEQAGGRPGTAASDMYALGLVAYECLTGRRPFDGEPLAVLRAHREDPVPGLPDTVPGPLRALVLGLLDKDPDARPTASQVIGRDPLTAPDRTAVLAMPGGPVGGPDTAPHAVGPAAPVAVVERAADAAVAASTRRPRFALGAAAGVLALLVLAVGLAGGDTGQPGTVPREVGPGDVAAGSGDAVEMQPLPVSAVALFHPGGSGRDRPDEVGLAADGDRGTAWTTQRYASPEFGNLRPGVGLMFDLGEVREVREVHLALDSPGLDLRVHAGDEPGDGLLDTPALGAVAGAQAQTVVPLAEPRAARYWVVWVERLPASGRHQAAVADTAFLG
ncbi:MAG TPA: serine/threonine-protein kinase [Mycobacteriales bacterium]|nr:serine/threonine-protein kinase [Mycobacteriales bacterium]